MKISIIITTKNEEGNIGTLLTSLIDQEMPFEIVVVDSFSNDRTLEIAESFKDRLDELYIYQYESTPGGGKNYGIEKSKGECVAFIDADCTASPLWLKSLRESAEEHEIVAGTTINVSTSKFDVSSSAKTRFYWDEKDVTWPGCNLLHNKRTFLELGGFDEELVSNEDIDLNVRAVQKEFEIHHNENAVLYHRMRSDISSLAQQMFWRGYGRGQMREKYGSLCRARRDLLNKWGWLRGISELMGYLKYRVDEMRR